MTRMFITEKEYKIEIQDGRYKSIATAFSTAAFRLIEKYLIHDCKHSFKESSSEVLRALMTIICFSRDNLLDSQAKTLVKFVQIAFGLA